MALTGCQREAPEVAYRPDDRDLWKALPQLQVPLAGDALTVRAIEQPKADGSHLFLFFGNAGGQPNNGDALVMQHLAHANPHSAVWYIDTPDALFMERSREAMRNQSGDFVLPILERIGQQFASYTLVSMDVTSVPVLHGLRQWQSQASAAERAKLTQLVLLYPSLYVNTPVAGQERVLFPIVRHTALPITIVQPELGAQANTIDEVVNALREGGSLVRLERVANANDGIYKYHNIRAMSAHTAKLFDDIEQAMRDERKKQGFQVATLPPYDASKRPVSTVVAGFTPIEGSVALQDIRLKSIDGHDVDLLRDRAGKAMLITFWATWCPHCVEEIPSMNRALAQLDRERFAIVSVSYKDTEAVMTAFQKKVPMDFPVLMDRDGQVSKAWKVYSFPSSFLVDRSGRVRYTINAGAMWDSPDVLEKLREISQ
jgi:peroxiredoxin